MESPSGALVAIRITRHDQYDYVLSQTSTELWYSMLWRSRMPGFWPEVTSPIQEKLHDETISEQRQV